MLEGVTEVPAEAPKVEAPVEAKVETKVEEPVSDKFAALARKEKSIVKAKQEIASIKAELERDRQAFSQQRAEFEKWQRLKENAKLDPDAYLNEAGLSYGYLTERTLKGNQDPNAILDKANQTIAEFKKQQEEDRKKAEEAAKEASKKQWEERVGNFRKGVHEFVEANKDTYELTTLHGQQNLVFEVINEAARRSQEMTVKEAADKVEEYLAQQIEKALTGSKKFKEKYELKKVEAKEDPKPSSPTLTNSMSASTSVSPPVMTEAQRMQRALEALNKAIGE